LPVTSGATATTPGRPRIFRIRPSGFLIFLTTSRGLTPSTFSSASLLSYTISRIGVCVSRGSSLTCTCPDDSTVSMMNLSLNPFIIESMARNIITLMITPAMHTSVCRLCESKYRMETIQSMIILS
jgi:hypothetical protein